MDIHRFSDSPIGRLVPIRVEQQGRAIDHFAYVPDPLPDSVDLTPGTYSVIERASAALGALEGAAHGLERPYMVTRPLMRREAQSTSALEGTFSTLEDLFAVGLDEGGGSETGQVAEVWNYVQAAEMAVDILRTRPVSLRAILQLHQVLMRGTRWEASAGSLREAQVAIGSRDALVTEARFIPPPPGDELEELFSDWERWNYREDAISDIARVAISHYQFETIHPFMDGNGRLGRLIVVMLLIDRGPLSNHYLVLSPYFEARRAQYQDLLAETSASGDFDPWVRFFAEALAAEAAAARVRIDGLLSYPRRIVEKLRAEGLRGAVIELADSLVEFPVLSASSVAERLGVSFQTANRVIGTLVDHGVLEEFTGRSYGRRYAAREVLDLLR